MPCCLCQKRLAFHDGGIKKGVGKGDPRFLFQSHPFFAQCNFPSDPSIEFVMLVVVVCLLSVALMVESDVCGG
jgi:hypothetical protein